MPDELTTDQRAALLGAAIDYVQAPEGETRDRANELILMVEAIRAEDERRATFPLVEIHIRTRKPSKWRFCDLETGESWKWRDDGMMIAAEDDHGI